MFTNNQIIFTCYFLNVTMELGSLVHMQRILCDGRCLLKTIVTFVGVITRCLQGIYWTLHPGLTHLL